MTAILKTPEQRRAFLEKERRWASRTLPPIVLGLGLILFGGELILRLGIIQGAFERVAPFAALGLGVTALTWASLRQSLSLKLASALYIAFSLVVILGALVAGASDVYAPGATLAAALILSVCVVFTFSPSPYILPLLCLSLYTLPAPTWAWLGGPEVPWEIINKTLVPSALVGSVMGELLRRRRRQVLSLSASLRRQANEDPLTGLPNRAHTFEMGEIALKRARREGVPISVILMDLDHFKAVNDTYGHPVGDEILRLVASLLRSEAKAFDIIGRVGGEEFVWIMPGSTAAECLERGAAFGTKLRDARHKVLGGELGVTISGGCVELTPGVLNLEAALRGADEALYQAKAQGRDRLCLGEGREPDLKFDSKSPTAERSRERASIDREASYLAAQFERTMRYLFWISLLRGAIGLLAPARAALEGVPLEVILSTHVLALGEVGIFTLACVLIITKMADNHSFLALMVIGAGYNLLLLGRIFDGPGGESAWFVTNILGIIFISVSISGWRLVLPLVLGKVIGTLPLLFLGAHLTLPLNLIILYVLWVSAASWVLYRVSESVAYRCYWLLESLRGEAAIDVLTEVFNRRKIMDLAHGETIQSREAQSPFTVLVLDIDHFKSINDSYGHAAGDVVLRSVAKELVDAGRVSDPVGRIGGEEFLILLPACDGEGAVIVAERILKRVSGRTYDFEGVSIPATLSIGIATLEEGEDFDALFRRGDEALYRAKEGGRNRYAINKTLPQSPAYSPPVLSFPTPSHA